MFVEFSYLALLLYFVLLAMSMAADRDWKLGKNYISDLGVSKSRPAKYLFNGGCAVCGTLFVISILEFTLGADLTLLGYSAMILSMMTGILLVLVGVVNENIMPHHKWVAFSYFIVRFILVTALTILALYNAQYVLAVVTAIVVVFALTSAKKLEFPATEVVWCVSLLGIIIIHLFMMV
jgi:hypothetical membrane protein